MHADPAHAGTDEGSRPRRRADAPGGGRPVARLLAEQVFSRVLGTDSVGGNEVHLLRDAGENYPAWLDAIAGARDYVNFENYIIQADEVGRRFADALCAKAREGVRVRVVYDWLGSRSTPGRFWDELRRAGAEVRCFNRPRLTSPFGWISRNHRKTLGVDGRIGFVSGLCVARDWEGDPARGVPPWRDTGISLRGPAVADLDDAFEQSWREAGGAAADADAEAPSPPPAPRPEPAGTVALRVVGTRPNTMGLYRLDQFVASLARRRLWLTDAYFVGTTAYVSALCDAARDGVDVRVLVPGASDIPITKVISRAGYRPLLEAGIRVFEWNGPMLHAKTAVADGRWGRIGSSNLNLASWIGNWELDVSIEDAAFAERMEEMFLHDLGNATEIVLDLGRVHAAGGHDERRPRGAARPGRRLPGHVRARRRRRGSTGRLAAGAVGIGSAVGAAITDHRVLGPAENRVMAAAAGLLLVLAAVAVFLPYLVTVPLACVCLLVAGALLVRSWSSRPSSRSAQAPPSRPPA